MLQQIALGGMMIALPIYLQMVLEYNAMQAGLSLAPLSLSMFADWRGRGKRAGHRRPASIIRLGFLLRPSASSPVPDRPSGDLRLVLRVPARWSPDAASDCWSPSSNNYTLSPMTEEQVSEAAGVNSAAGSFGLSFGLAFAGADHARHPVRRLHAHWRTTAPCSTPPSSSRSQPHSRTTPS